MSKPSPIVAELLISLRYCAEGSPNVSLSLATRLRDLQKAGTGPSRAFHATDGGLLQCRIVQLFAGWCVFLLSYYEKR
jgi:hypothetical protein